MWTLAVACAVQMAYVSPVSAQDNDPLPDSTYVYHIALRDYENNEGEDEILDFFVCSNRNPVSDTVFVQDDYGLTGGHGKLVYDARWGPFKTTREVWAVMGDKTYKDGSPLEAMAYLETDMPIAGSMWRTSREAPPGSGPSMPISWVAPVIALVGVIGLGVVGLLAVKALLQPKPPPPVTGSPSQPLTPGSPFPVANTAFGSPPAQPFQVALSGVTHLCEPGCETTPQHKDHHGTRPIEQFQTDPPAAVPRAPPTRTRYQVGEPNLFPGQPELPEGNGPNLVGENPGVFGQVTVSGVPEGFQWPLVQTNPEYNETPPGSIDLLIRLASGGNAGTPPAQAIAAAVRFAAAAGAAAQATAPGALSAAAAAGAVPPVSPIPPPAVQPQVAVVKTQPGPDPRVTDADVTALADIEVGERTVADILTSGPRGQSEAAAVAGGDTRLLTAYGDFPEWANRTADWARQFYAGVPGGMAAALTSQYGPVMAADIILRAEALNAVEAAGVPLPTELFGYDPNAYRIVENPPASMLTDPHSPSGFDPDDPATWHQQLQGVAY